MRLVSVVSTGLMIWMVLGVVAGGCSSSEPGGRSPGTSDSGLGDENDSGSLGFDGGALDAGTAPPPGDGLIARPSSAAGSRAAECVAEGCGPDCGDVRSCCVGAGTCCAPVAASVLPDLDSSSCDDGPAATCLAGVLPFGDPMPSIYENGIAPGGDGSGDSGFMTTETVDLTLHRLTIGAHFTPAEACGVGCFETAGVGVTIQGAVTGELRTLASLTYASARDRLVLMVRDVVVDYLDEPTLTTDYVLDLQPTGEVAVRDGVGGSVVLTARYRPSSGARVAVFGHTVNPSSTSSPTTLQITAVKLELCDVPTRWRDRRPVLVDGGEVVARGASLVAGPVRVLTYERGGEIFFAEAADAPHEFTSLSLPEPAISADAVSALVEGVATFRDPELVRHGEGWRLFFTLSDDGVASIAQRDFSLDFRMAADPEITIAPRISSRPGMNDVTIEVREPTVFRHMSEEWVMVVRARTPEATWLEIYRADSTAASFTLFEVPALGTSTRRGDDVDTSGFGRDEVSRPALSIHNGAWHLHFTARRGTRSSIGLLVSDDLLSWRSPTDGAVLDAGSNPWEALGVEGPAVAANGDTLEMLYSGLDGVRSTLGWATRSGTDEGAF